MRRAFAVIAGVNDYPGTGLDLSGCVNDALDMSELVRDRWRSQALVTQKVDVLMDAHATKANVTEALRSAISQAGWGDRILYHWSGHGTWVPDRDGDEIDFRDEAQCLYDFQDGGLFTDDELHTLFSATRAGVGVLLLSDSCHSGTMARMVETDVAVPAECAPKFMPPSLMYDISTERAIQIEQAVDTRAPRKTTNLISGCADHEYSYDAWFGSRPNGAFTRAAVDALRADPGLSLKGWWNAIRTKLPSGSYPQTPQLTYTSLYRAYTKPF